MTEKTCKTCAYKYHDDFCMGNCMYVNDEHKCQRWTDEPLEFDYDRVYRLCKDYVKLCDDYGEYKELCEKYPDRWSLKVSENNYKFFFNCCINDLHRELSLWKTKR